MAISGNVRAHENLADQNAREVRRELQWLLGFDLATTPGGGSGGVARSGHCAVSQRGAGANMSVDVAVGFVVAGPNSGGTGYGTGQQGAYCGFNDAVLNVAITASDPVNPRIDRIGFGIRDSEYAGASNDGEIVVIAGTPAGVPTLPAVPNTYIAWVDLAQVSVAALAASIVNANITDLRRRLSSLGGIHVCTSTTRPATNLWAGQTIYETDTNRLLTYNGSAWNGPTGMILQCLSTLKNDTFSTASTTFTDVTGLSVTITPRAASNKVLVRAFVTLGESGVATVKWNLLRDASAIAQPSGGTDPATVSQVFAGSSDTHSTSAEVLDSPATTSATTYKVQIKTSAGTVWVNRRQDNSNQTMVSTITVQEVAA